MASPKLLETSASVVGNDVMNRVKRIRQRAFVCVLPST
ncbi:hypothetical protein V1288_006528 [Bradyrhizobium sp. AZCC 2176]